MSGTMLKYLLLYALAFIVSSMEQNVEYSYEYAAILSMGAPEINNNASGMRISTTLTLQMKTNTRGIAKLSDIKVSSFANEKICLDEHSYFQTPLNKNKPMMMYKEKFEMPFAVNLDPKADVKMLVEENEEEFITNIRKSILNLIRSDVIKKVYQHDIKDQDWHHVVQEEETLFGKCPVHYTFGPASFPFPKTFHMLNSSDNQNYHLDGSKLPKSAHTIHDTYIDFDKCKDPVVLQKTSLGNLTGSSKNMFKSILSRLSTENGHFLLVNKDKEDQVISMLRERKGHVIINPFGFQSEKFIMKTNQMIFGGMPEPIMKPLRLPAKTKEIKTLLFEVASSYPAPHHPKPWINYNATHFNLYPISELFTTGIKATDELYNNTVYKVMNLVEKAVDSMTSHPESKSKPTLNAENDLGISYMVEATKLIKILPDEFLTELYGTIENDMKAELKRTLLIDAFAAAGTTSSIRILLMFIQKEMLTPTREASVWITLANSVESAEIADYLVDYVQGIDSRRTVPLSSAALVSVATIVNRLCVNPKRTEYLVQKDLYGAQVCHSKDVLKNLMEYLQLMILVNLDPMREPYFVQALSNLASPNDTLSIFENIIHKKIRPATGDRIRTLAVYALEKNKMGEAMRERVFKTLMSLFYDETESEEMRQSAFITMLTWEPESAWWQRMAKHTWMESSPNVASFMYFTMKSLAETSSMALKKQSTIASFVLPLAKPLPESYSKSFNLIFAKYLHRENIDTQFHFEWLSNPSSFIPRQAYSHLSTSFGGVDFNLFEVALSVYDLNSKAMKHPTSEEAKKEEHLVFPHLNKDLAEGIEKFMKKLNNRKASKSEPVANLLLRAFDNIYAFLPLRIKDLNPFNKENQENFQIENHYAKFFSPESSQMVIPTDVGLPLVLEVSSSVLGYVDHANIVNAETECRFIINLPFPNCVRIEYDLRLSTKLTSSIKTFLPWSNETVLVAVDNSKKLLLPINITYEFSQDDKDSLVSLAFGSLNYNKFPMIMVSNEPYTAIKSILPGLDAQTVSHNTIHVGNSSLQKEIHDLSSDISNLNFTLKYEGDVNFPFSSANFIDLIRQPEKTLTWLSSSTLKKYDFSLDFDPTTSRTKQIRLLFDAGKNYSFFVNDIKSKFSSEQNKPETIHSSLKRFSDFPTKKNTTTAQLMQLKIVFCHSENCRGEFDLYGIRLLYDSKKMENNRRVFSSDVLLLALNWDKTRKEGINLGMESQIESPDISSYESLLRELQSGKMEVNYKGNAFSREILSHKNQLFSFTGSLNISDELRERLLEDLQKDCLREGDTFEKDLNTVLAYDEASIALKYNLTHFGQNMLNISYALKDWSKGIYFPHYISNTLHIENEEELLEVFAKRMVREEDYDLFIKRPKEQISISGFKFPFGVNKLFSYSDLHEKRTLIKSGGNISYCDIENNSMNRSFDGLLLDFPINNCFLLLNTENIYYAKYYLYAVLNHDSKPMLLLFLLPDSKIIYISEKEIKIGDRLIYNREVVELKDEYGITFLRIDTTGKYRIVDFVTYFSIEVRNASLRIYSDLGRSTTFMGMCGNANGNKEDDLTDFKNCTYDSPKYLGAAWTVFEPSQKTCTDQLWLMKLIKDMAHHRQCPV